MGEAVVKEEFNRRRRMAELVKYAGSFSDTFPTNEEIEAIDAKRSRNLFGRSHGLDVAHDDAHFDELAKLEV